jgi:hypothetical protein
MSARAPVCPYCGRVSVYCASSAHIYQGRDFGPVYDCRPCDAYVGADPAPSRRPKGRLANKSLRQLKVRAHGVFNALYAPGGPHRSRGGSYQWLAEAMQLRPVEAHIGLFDEQQCEAVIRLATDKLNKELERERRRLENGS